MAGRGRGGGARGRGMSFNVEILGIGRGDVPHVAVQQPPALYPPLTFKPVPLATGDDQDYLLAVKQEFQNTLRDSPFFVRPPSTKKDIHRYSDRYQLNSSSTSDGQNWQPDWSRFPSELKGTRRRRIPGAIVKPNIAKFKSLADDVNIETKLKELESKEEDMEGEPDDRGEEKKPKEGDEDEEKEIEDDEFYDEEELEEGTDYNTNYFDNGEEFDDEEDNLDDGAVYS